MFPFDIPPDLIAQEPLPTRDHSRLMVLHRDSQRIGHRHFSDLPEFLRPNDLLILNNTRVLPARLLGHREKTGGKWEGLFLQVLADGPWEMLCQTRGRLRPGEWISVPDATESRKLRLEVQEQLAPGRWRFRPDSSESPTELLAAFGHMPLPPYIRKGRDRPEDRDRYQTVFAKRPGAIAAPTAGLHFTPELLRRLTDAGIKAAYVTLHVGLGTFQPIQAADYRDHPMHAEWGELSDETVQAIAECRRAGGRVVAVGTTSVRVLETASALGSLKPWSGETRLFLHPPYEFRAVDALITNFHLPQTTLLLLVAAFAGVEFLERSYREAIANRYRFYSYGDAMLIA